MFSMIRTCKTQTIAWRFYLGYFRREMIPVASAEYVNERHITTVLHVAKGTRSTILLVVEELVIFCGIFFECT